MTKEDIELIEKLVKECVEARVDELVKKALDERKAEVLEAIAEGNRRQGFLGKIIGKGGGNGN